MSICTIFKSISYHRNIDHHITQFNFTNNNNNNMNSNMNNISSNKLNGNSLGNKNNKKVMYSRYVFLATLYASKIYLAYGTNSAYNCNNINTSK